VGQLYPFAGAGRAAGGGLADTVIEGISLTATLTPVLLKGNMAADSDIDARQKKLLEQLAAAPVVDVLGVVAPSGAGGGRSGGEDLWTLFVTFDAWRVGHANLQTKPLILSSRGVTHEELASLQDALVPYTVVRIKARVGESAFGGHEALLEAFIGTETSDAELNDQAEQLRKPVTVEDPAFGTFTLDRGVDWFTAEVVWDGQPVSLHLSGSAEVQASLKTAYALWQRPTEWNRQVRNYAVQELLPLKNDSWLAEGESEITPEEFKDRMTLESITVYPDGSFDFFHHDGDLFWGHAIQVSGTLSQGPTHADIPG
jgi:hypothetical protein